MRTWSDEVRFLVRGAASGELGAGATETEVSAAELCLDVEFPAELRVYLLELGFVSIRGREFNGLGNGVPKHLNLCEETLAEREQFMPFLPNHLLPIENDGWGNHYCVDLSAKRDDPPVVFWDHQKSAAQVPDPEAERFSSWLLQCVTNNVA